MFLEWEFDRIFRSLERPRITKMLLWATLMLYWR